MNIFLTLIIFYIGAAFGSFLSVIVQRTQRKMSGILVGRSVCLHCKHQLGAMDLIPIVSYLVLWGKCRYCKKSIAPHYILMELITGIVVMGLYLVFPFFTYTAVSPYTSFSTPLFWEFLRYGILSLVLLAIFFYDLLFQEIPDSFSLTGILVALLGNIALTSPPPLDFVIGATAGFLFFFIQILISRGAWVGSGDALLGILMGMILGWKLLIVALFLSYIIGTFVSIWLLAAKKATRKTKIPFAPFLVTGTILAILFGNQIVSWYVSTLLV